MYNITCLIVGLASTDSHKDWAWTMRQALLVTEGIGTTWRISFTCPLFECQRVTSMRFQAPPEEFRLSSFGSRTLEMT